MSEGKELHAVICDPDSWALRALESMLREAGFEVVAETHNAIETLRENEYLHPALIVMTNELFGLSGLDALRDLRAGDDPPEVILISTDDTGREAAKHAGAFDLAVKGDVEMLQRMLDEVHELIVTGERRTKRDRRNGQRRTHQDWSKVTHERRDGQERRSGLRREKDVLSTAKDILRQQREPKAG